MGLLLDVVNRCLYSILTSDSYFLREAYLTLLYLTETDLQN